AEIACADRRKRAASQRPASNRAASTTEPTSQVAARLRITAAAINRLVVGRRGDERFKATSAEACCVAIESWKSGVFSLAASGDTAWPPEGTLSSVVKESNDAVGGSSSNETVAAGAVSTSRARSMRG